MLEHSEVLFDYLVDANGRSLASCPEATGRIAAGDGTAVRSTDEREQRRSSPAAAMVPPWQEFCFVACISVWHE